MKALFYSIPILFLIILHSAPVKAQVEIDLESGYVFTGYNDVRIPGDQGTLFSLKDDLVAEPTFYYRLRLSYTIKSRHSLSLLYAPLETRSEGSKAQGILFEGVVFPANTDFEGTYVFNSYRLTYRYDIVKNPGFYLSLG